MKKVDLSIIILSYNTKKLLKDCLESVIQNSIPRTEIIIIDNGSTDGSKKYINELTNLRINGLRIRGIFNEKNLGFAKGNNIGIKQAKGEYIMLLNSDSLIKEDAIGKLLEFLDRDDPCQTAVSPLLLLPNGEPQVDYYMRFPNLWQIFLYHHSLLRPFALKIPFLRNKIIGPDSPLKSGGLSPWEVDQLPGAALMVPCAVWEKVGLLDEDYKFLYEDVDWCWRAKKLGYKLMIVPDAKIVHFGGGSWKQKLKESSFEFYCQYFSSMLLFVKKNYGEAKFKIFRIALVINFLLQFKFKLARYFLKNKDIFAQNKLWD